MIGGFFQGNPNDRYAQVFQRTHPACGLSIYQPRSGDTPPCLQVSPLRG